ncbi:hypothetical protein [Natrarchaeobius chitinivorans]|uniref:Uncharacterized protein n=1 Tax=Natrarchaeobius chitinivorans TaxID=1679083 RepID=A0A3N6LRW7_NATCH|nr:hypothetical protein [Natrarchaeobius chitinivorans]RQG92568.1 hypothetical protein EA473_16100 [Natrarchaeobius chitinivorans]
MSEKSGLKQLVAEEVSEQVEVTDLIGNGSLEDEVDGGEVGAAVGRSLGERIGRELGASVGRELHETIARGLEDEERDLGDVRSDVTTAIRDAVTETVEDSSARDSLESVGEAVADDSRVEGLLEETEEKEEVEEEEVEEEEAEPDEDERESDETEEDSETAYAEAADEDESAPSAADLEELRRETLEDFLAVLSYEDLQSIAKDVDVKANLSREEMTDEIVDTVAAETDSESASAADEESDADAESEGEPDADTESEANGGSNADAGAD